MSPTFVIPDNGITQGAGDSRYVQIPAAGRGFAKVYNLRDAAYGAVPDRKTVADGAITSGLTDLTSASNLWTSADVGKLVKIKGAGTTGTLLYLTTTIATFVSAGHVTTTLAASHTVSSATVDWGTDNATAFAAGNTAAVANNGGRLYLPADGAAYCTSVLLTLGDHVDWEGETSGDATFVNYHGGSQICCMTAAAGIKWPNTAVGRVVEKLFVDGGGIATNPVHFQFVQSKVENFMVARADGDNMIIDGNAQNLELDTIQSNDCNGCCLAFDGGAGGIAIERSEFFNSTGFNVEFRETAAGPGYLQPTDISFNDCELEHDGSSTFSTTGSGKVHVEAGASISFHDTYFQMGVAGDLVLLEETGFATSSVVGPVFDNCTWAAGSSVTNLINIPTQISGGCVFMGRNTASGGPAATFMRHGASVNVVHLAYGVMPVATAFYVGGAGASLVGAAFRSDHFARIRGVVQNLTDAALEAKLASDTFGRNKIFADGSVNFGGGSGDVDTAISRTAAGALSVNGSWTTKEVIASGKTGAVSFSAYGGATASGHPTTGLWTAGEWVVDRTGTLWFCTVGDGTSVGTWITLQSAPGALNPAPWFADGSDGAVAFDGTTANGNFATTTGSSPNKVYTLIRDVFATSLTVSAGITVNTANFRIYVTGTLANAGTIQSNGANGANSTTTASGAGGAGVASASLRGTVAGGAGAVAGGAAATAGTSLSGSNTLGGAGGAGGNGTSQNGATFGAVIHNAGGFPGRTLDAFLTGAILASNAVVSFTGGTSGGGGGADAATQGGGGGGASGGIVLIACQTLNNTGTIQALGGNGGNGSTAGAGGGGGGGGGGALLLSYQVLTAIGTTLVTGGTHGTGSNANGLDGSAGNVYQKQLP